jgi:hypothetical protein
MLITSVLLLLVLVDYYLSLPVIHDVANAFLSWAVIISSITIILGLLNMLVRWVPRIRRKEKEWYFQVWAIFLIALMIVTGLSSPPAVFGTNPWFVWMFTNVQFPLDASIYALLGFYIASAVYRSFRAKTKEAVAFLIAGVLLIMANAPVVEYWLPGQSDVGLWVLNVINMGSRRAMLVVVALGVVAFAARTLVWRERTASG